MVGCDVQQYVVHNLGFLLASENGLFGGRCLISSCNFLWMETHLLSVSCEAD